MSEREGYRALPQLWAKIMSGGVTTPDMSGAHTWTWTATPPVYPGKQFTARARRFRAARDRRWNLAPFTIEWEDWPR